jgi:hypothetical protein
MAEHFAIHCRLDPTTQELEFLGVAAVDETGTAYDVRPVSPRLAALAERLLDRSIVAEALVVASFKERWIGPDPRQ